MKIFRSKRVLHFFSLVLALLVLNLSIDPPDLLINLDSDVALEEDLSINEMESVAEVILEKALDMDNALPETDDQDNDNMVKKAEVCWNTCSFYLSNQSTILIGFSNYIAEKPFYFFDAYLENFSPPPEA